MKTIPTVAVITLVTVAIGLQRSGADDDVKVDFTRDVRPILSNACFHCHGPDQDTREADLRLDQHAGLFDDRGGYVAVKPGDVSNSELVRRLLSDDPDEVMPPPQSNKKLTQQQRATLVKWVEQGAAWEKHWSFEQPVKPNVPQSTDDNWSRNEIDRFIVARLRAAGLQPSPEADVYTLVRRLYLDLIGLPPTPAEADTWVAKLQAGDGEPVNEAAFQELVTHLLASPHYGERWARRWLDLARYADTNGYEKDRERSIWPYRDWVVNAINSDMPFDRFTIEQLAGDMLPDATIDQKIATGFHRNTMLNEEGGIDPLEFRYHAMTDRNATTGTTWLGLTIGCCQCHTHKYDPISHHEYFQLMAFLNNADEPRLALPDAGLDRQWKQNRAKADELVAQLANEWPVEAADQLSESEVAAKRESAVEAAFEEWLAAEQPNAVEWVELQPTEATSNLPILTIQPDNSIFASGDTAKRDDYFVTFAPSSQPITALRLEALPDERLPSGGPGSTYYEGPLGDFFLNELKASSGESEFAFASASQTYAKNRFGNSPATAALAIDGDVQTGWSVYERPGERHVAVYQLRQPIPAGTPLRLQMTFGRHFASSLGRFRWSACESESAPQARTYGDDIASSLRQPRAALDEARKKRLFETFLLNAEPLTGKAEEIRKLRKRPEATTSLVMAERPTEHPRPTFRHHRGEYLQPKDQVTAGLPEVLSADGSARPRNRLEFAQWLVSDANPLTARVVVNRHWATLFGTGIVRTVDDFGLQGESPSHPKLLDWLAVTFREDDGWSLKNLHRRIVSSATYRQASIPGPDAAAIDPDNRLLSFLPRLRLEAEILRDQLLVAAGVLSDKIGGPPVRPPQPAGVTESAYGKPSWDASTGEDRYRRSLYTFSKRTAPFAMFTTFDAPTGEACIAVRDRSNSPLQALTLLNDVMTVDLARQAGCRAAAASAESDTAEQMNSLFRRVLVRPPGEAEQQSLAAFWEQRRDHFVANTAEAREFMQVGDSDEVTPLMLAEQAAWTATARAIFGLDEALNRE
ncbi:PSD1 and planctomycete cytochrome C domain-containing protein [Fuerstiella marisgermanici]|nr:PSD1 and planctomycete cytochrome C domain-containing protein [Fuerstiella marisgermanici]